MNVLLAPTAALTIGLAACSFQLDRQGPGPADGSPRRDLAVDLASDLGGPHDLDVQQDSPVQHDLAPDATAVDTAAGVLTWGGSHTDQQCTAVGGNVFSAPAGTLCRLAADSCPSGWSQAGNWQRYDPSSWGGDHCGSWKSGGPGTFANAAASSYGHGTWQGCDDGYACPHAEWIEMTTTTSCGTKLHRATVEGPSAAGSTNRVEIGCI
jgi:hypothetical protein